MPRPLRVWIIMLPSLAFAVIAVLFLFRTPPEPVPAGTASPALNRFTTAKLVVVVCFDQMRGDYLDRWSKQFGSNGFEKLKREGVWYSNAHLPYGCSSTGPGHASIGTGQPPSVHGIIENRWYDRATGREINGASGDKRTRRIPEVPGNDDPAFAPDRLLCEGIGDQLLKFEGAKARVFSFSLKERSAVLMGGKHPTGVYAFDTVKGEFHTSSYYTETVPAWVTAFNKSGKADGWFGQNWDRLGDGSVYDRVAGPDNVASEGVGINAQGRTFPHPLSFGLAEPNKKYYDALENSGHGNDLLWEFTKACLDGEQLGRAATHDLLFVSFSSNDLIGHVWGPDSHEVLDVTLRSDRLIAELIMKLDLDVGVGNYTLIVTADHGVCPMPELAVKNHTEATRFNPKEVFGNLGLMLDEKFGPVGDSPELWVSKIAFPDIYLNRAAMTAAGKPIGEVETAVAQWAGNRDSMLVAFTRSTLAGPVLNDPLARRMQLGYQAERSGDVVVVNQPYCLPIGKLSFGSSHGSPHDYDTHVPVLFYGAGIPGGDTIVEPVSSFLVAEQIKRSLGLPR